MDKASSIRKMVKDGMTIDDIGRMMGISSMDVRDILEGATQPVEEEEIVVHRQSPVQQNVQVISKHTTREGVDAKTLAFIDALDEGKVSINVKKERTHVVHLEQEDEDPEVEYKKGQLIQSIKALGAEFKLTIPTDEAMEKMTLKQLESKQKLTLGMCNKSFGIAALEESMMRLSLGVVEKVATYLGCNLSSPVSMTEAVMHDPGLQAALKQVSILSQYSTSLRTNPYVNMGLVIAGAAGKSWITNNDPRVQKMLMDAQASTPVQDAPQITAAPSKDGEPIVIQPGKGIFE